ncbi:LacI family DNA-binding transcriptional regulator [Nioella sp.]|uniref:LacI family DNA-binding transcriptional regulator n=1 Tax=Nioella sp. TaxID=1912091 RepID=UPI003B52ED46
MAKRPTSIKQVADAAGVSTATVSNVFSGKKPVNPDLAQRVRDTAAALGYQVNRAASNLRSGQSRVVPVMVPDLSDPFFTQLITEIEARAEADGYDIIVASSKDDPEIERRRVNALLSWQPAGMIIVPCTDRVPEPLVAAKETLPIVLADRGEDAEGFDRVYPDNEEAGRIVGDHLVGLGHRHVLIVASDMRLKAIRRRCDGAARRIEASGGIADLIEVGPEPRHGAAMLSDWLQSHPMPSALFAVTDMTTLAILNCLAARNCEVGRDVSVVGFDDYPWMSARRTPITAIQQPVDGIAQNAWSTLRARMSGKEPDALREPLHCVLRLRASTSRTYEEAGAREESQRGEQKAS